MMSMVEDIPVEGPTSVKKNLDRDSSLPAEESPNGAAGLFIQTEGSPGPAPIKQTAPGAGEHGKVSKGAIWVILGFGTLQVLRFGFNLAFTHMLVPEAFGLMALVNTLFAGIFLFSDFGIGPSIVQSKNGDNPSFLNTAWTIQIIRGFLIWLFSMLIAWPAATFYEIPMLKWLIPAVGASAAIDGFTSTSLRTFSRRVIRGPLVILQIGSYTVGMLVTVAWMKWVKADVWGFVLGGVISSFLTMAISHRLIRDFRNRLCWDRQCLGELFRFGKWIFLSTMCMFVARDCDDLIIAKMASLERLGVYQVASQLAWVPALLFSSMATQLVFPLYSRLHRSQDGLKEGIARVHPTFVGLAAFMASGLIAVGPSLVKCLYGPRYEDAGWMVQLLAIGAWLKMMDYAGNAILVSRGDSRGQAINNGVKVVALVILVPPGIWLGGLKGLIIAMAATDLVRYLVMVLALRRHNLTVLAYDFPLTLCLVVVSATALYFGNLPGLAADPWTKLGVTLATVIVLWSGIIVGIRSNLYRPTLEVVR